MGGERGAIKCIIMQFLLEILHVAIPFKILIAKFLS